MIGERLQPKPPPAVPATRPAGPDETSCPQCGSAVPPGACWCPGCALTLAGPCWECGLALADGAVCCAFCGAPAAEPAVIGCPACGAVVRRGYGYCATCGMQARPVCSACDQPMRRAWEYCPRCGGEPTASEEPTSAPERAVAAPSRPSVEVDPEVARRKAQRLTEAASAAYEAENYPEAVRLFREALEVEGDNPAYWTNLGVALAADDEALQAIGAYQRALSLDPRALNARLFLGQLFLERERYSEARDAWEAVIRLGPDSEEAAEARENLRSLDEV